MKQFIRCFFLLLIAFIHYNNAADNNDQNNLKKWFDSDKGKLIKSAYKMIVIKTQEEAQKVGGIKNSIIDKVHNHLERRRSIYNKNGGNELKYFKSKLSEKSKNFKKELKQKVFDINKFVEENYKHMSNEHDKV